MQENRFELRLQSSDDGSSTHLRLCGKVAAPPPASEVAEWLRLLSQWSGRPVELVLSADSGSVAWFASWGDTVSQVPVRHLQIRFIESLRHRVENRDATR